MSIKLILYSAITIIFNGAVLRRYLKDELLLAGPYTLLVILPTITQPICQLIFGGFCGITLFAIASYQIYKRLPQQFVKYDDKVVFISGCDSGFGFETAKTLDAKGVHVIAGCLLKGEAGEQDLVKSCSNRLVTIQLDVTKEDSIQNAVKEVKEKLQGRDLWALVNNAGILYMGEAEILSIKFARNMMDVNFMGAVRLTQAFLPMLRQSQGRVMSLCSLGSDVAVPFFAEYCASKAALKSFMDVLRLEMFKWNVTVSTVHPSGYKTSMLDADNIKSKLDAVNEEIESSVKEDYGPYYKDEWYRLLSASYGPSEDLTPVINTIEHALFAKSPLTSYFVEPSSEILTWISLCLPVSFTKYIFWSLMMSKSFIGKDSKMVSEKNENPEQGKVAADNSQLAGHSGETNAEE